MAALASVFARSVTPSTVFATLAATGITFGLLWWVTHRVESRINTRTNRMAAHFAGEVRGLRDESECRWLTQRTWPTNRSAVAKLLLKEDPDGR